MTKINFNLTKKELAVLIADGGAPKNDETRKHVCSYNDPKLAAFYAIKIDKEIHEDTRKVALQDPQAFAWYAFFLNAGFDEPGEPKRSTKWVNEFAKYIIECMLKSGADKDQVKELFDF